MAGRFLLSLALVAAVVGSSPAADALPSEGDVRKAIERSLPFIEEKGVAWMNERGCASCHTVSFMLWSFNEARRHGVAVDARKLEEWTNWTLLNTVLRGKEGGGLDTMSQLLLGRDTASRWREIPERYPKGVDPFETIWENLLDRQNANGSWPVEGQLTVPPEVSTRWALLALAGRDTPPTASTRNLGPAFVKQLKKIDEAIPRSRDRALAFLKDAKQADTIEGLQLRMQVERKFGTAERADEFRKELLQRQNADGGWSNRPDVKESDAYATGQSLYALRSDGLSAEDVAIRRACGFLVQTQRKDGAWQVATRQVRAIDTAHKADPIYVFWGTTWATIGLSQTLPTALATKAE
jgi:Prenyltransferase and squalene oxidase repeat